MTTTLVLVATTKTPSAILVSIPCEQAFPVYTGCCWSLQGTGKGLGHWLFSFWSRGDALWFPWRTFDQRFRTTFWPAALPAKPYCTHTVHNPKDVLTRQIQSSRPSFFYEPTQTTKEVPKLIYYIAGIHFFKMTTRRQGMTFLFPLFVNSQWFSWLFSVHWTFFSGGLSI